MRNRGSARGGSKSAKTLELPKRAGGATAKEFMEATRWQPRSVCGFLARTVSESLADPAPFARRVPGEHLLTRRSGSESIAGKFTSRSLERSCGMAKPIHPKSTRDSTSNDTAPKSLRTKPCLPQSALRAGAPKP